MAELRWVGRLDAVAAEAWDALHDGTNPFVSHAFLHGLEATGCLRPRWGWTPRHALFFEQERLVAAAPAYRKDNSHGEFVFDFAWASAYERAGREYYPKTLVGIPYSPVTGPRLLARDPADRARLAAALRDAVGSSGGSSVHVNFLRDDECAAFDGEWLARQDVQFHWHDRGWRDFEGFLGALSHKRRKAIRQERDKVRAAGYRFRVVRGDEADASDLDAMHAFYCLTFAEKGNSPALTREFFGHLAQALPRALVLVLAERPGSPAPIAGALCLRGGDTLYGRYWGSSEAAPGLHFETCYYQGIDYCLREGLTRFEPGAQGEHKLARGFLPVLTHSRHYVADPDFLRALGPWCAREREGVARYRDMLLAHSPFRDDDPAAPPRP
jgi:predicted N-acyltransferase